MLPACSYVSGMTQTEQASGMFYGRFVMLLYLTILFLSLFPVSLGWADENASQWFYWSRLPIAVGIAIFFGVVIFCIYRAKSGKQPFVRRISGLEAIDEAIGRATEMGSSILYVSGIGSVKSIATIASMNILARVARMAAEYDTPLYVPCSDPMVMNIERELVQNAHLDAGRPDTYRQENVSFICEEQFAYAAAVDGIIVRERPATIFYMGAFMAESLILAEVGNATGAVQVAGTASITQLPWNRPCGIQTVELGDIVESALTKIGITSARVSRWLGHTCTGCKERQSKLNRLSRWAKRVLRGKSADPKQDLDKLTG